MSLKNVLLEKPVGDYLPDEFKRSARESGMIQDPAEKREKQQAMMSAMSQLPQIERANKSELEDLAVEAVFRIYPDLKTMVDAGKIVIDAKLESSSGRFTSQSVPQSQIEKVKEKNPNFSELQKKRNYINAITQGKSWIEGFNYVTNFMDEELDQINPQLYDKYRDFTRGISDFYWSNADMLERMAANSTGRMAYVDVTRTGDGKVKIEARAPFLPLLVHELVKGAEYMKSAYSLPKDPELRQALLKTTDTHKHEIQNMNYGRSIVNKMRSILGTRVNGYEPYMEVHIVSELEMLPETEFNRIMDGIISDDKDAMREFVVFAERVVKEM